MRSFRTCKKGIVEEVLSDEKSGSNLVYYMQHTPVVRESCVTTKVQSVLMHPLRALMEFV